MNQRQLECFIATARCRSLTQAAQELFLTQPGVTYARPGANQIVLAGP